MNWRALTGSVLLWSWSAFSNTVSTQSFYVGMCDASAAVALNNELFAVANDEDNSLRIYHAAKGGAPVYRHDLSVLLRVDRKKPRPTSKARRGWATGFSGSVRMAETRTVSIARAAIGFSRRVEER